MAPGLVEHFPQVDAGTKTRAIAATVVDLDDTRSLIAERDENETAKPFTVSERVAIGRAIEERLGERRGRPSENVQNSAQFDAGTKTRALAAERAGFGNHQTYRQAKAVVESGSPELVEAVDEGEVSVSAAAEIARQPHDEQREIVARGRDEIETAKPFTESESVAIGRAIEERLAGRQGQRTDLRQEAAEGSLAAETQLPADWPEVLTGTETRDIAAKSAGFDSTARPCPAFRGGHHAAPVEGRGQASPVTGQIASPGRARTAYLDPSGSSVRQGLAAAGEARRGLSGDVLFRDILYQPFQRVAGGRHDGSGRALDRLGLALVEFDHRHGA